MWNKISTEEEAKRLLDIFGGFHDGCIRELHLWGGYFVQEDLWMVCPETPDLRCSVIVQRQVRNPSAIELLFDGVSVCSVLARAGHDRIISWATLAVDDSEVVWSPDADFNPSSCRSGESSAIVARQMWWRERVDGLGQAGAEWPIEVKL